MHLLPHRYCFDALAHTCVVQTGKCVLERQIHEKHIMDLQVSTDQTHFVTASNDKSAKLVDTQASEQGYLCTAAHCCISNSRLGDKKASVWRCLG